MSSKVPLSENTPENALSTTMHYSPIVQERQGQQELQEQCQEQQERQRQYAGFWLRLCAFLIDNVLIMLAITPLLTMIYGVEYWQIGYVQQGIWHSLITWGLPATVMILFWVYRSATPGKIMLGLIIIPVDGKSKKITPAQAIVRHLGYYLALLPLGLGFIWIALDKRKQGWHDKLSNTLVIKEAKGR